MAAPEAFRWVYGARRMSQAAPVPASRLLGMTCSACAAEAPAEAVGACPACSAPLRCRYDLRGLEAFPAAGPRWGSGVFRWGALLPVRDERRRLSLGEGDTPVTPLPRLAADLGLATLWVKDEGQSPQGSFKARGLAVAVAAHAERGAKSVTLPTAGNAGAAAAAYARRHGLGCRVVLPGAATSTYRTEARLCGARIIGVNGDLGVAGAWVAEHPGPEGDHLLATFREPFRVEGKKTMGFELWEAFGEALPDAVVYPTGGGVGIVAMHAAFAQLRQAGLLAAAGPRFVAAQVESCSPVVRAFESGADAVAPWETTRRTLAEGLRVPKLAGGRLVLQALRESGGTAVAVPEPKLVEAIRRCAELDGVLLGAEGGVALAGLQSLRARAELAGARVLIFNTGSIYKSPETLQAAGAG